MKERKLNPGTVTIIVSLRPWTAALAAALVLAACGTEDVNIPRDTSPDRAETPDTPPEDAADPEVPPDAPDIPAGDNLMEFDWLDGACGGMYIEVRRLPANLVFVMDRSSSMLSTADGHAPAPEELGSCAETNADPATGITFTTRWDDARGAAGGVADDYGDRINFGLVLFPGPGSLEGAITPPLFCTGPVAAPKVMVAPVSGAAAAIGAALDDPANNPICSGGFTPVVGGIAAARGALDGAAEPGIGAVILATDGAPNCNAALPSCAGTDCTTGTPFCNGTLGTIGCLDDGAAVAALGDLLAAGVKTYVIGIPGSEDYAAVLDAMAAAGGTARAGSPRYFKVSDRDELADTLGAIADTEVSCTFALDQVPPNTHDVNVLADDEPLRRDDPDGFTYDEASNAITLAGQACADLKGGATGDVKFLFGCEPFI